MRSLRRIWDCGLRQLRKDRGKTLKQVAEETGVPISTLQQAEVGYSVRLDTAMTLASYYKRSVHSLWKPLEQPHATT